MTGATRTSSGLEGDSRDERLAAAVRLEKRDRLLAIADHVDTRSARDKKVVNELVAEAVEDVTSSRRRADVAADIALRVAGFFAIAGTLLVAPVAGGVLAAGHTPWPLVGAAAVGAGVLVLASLQAFRLVGRLLDYEFWWIPVGLPVVVLLAASWPGRFWTGPSLTFRVLSVPWLHGAIMAAALTFSTFAVAYAVVRIGESLELRRHRRRLRGMPESNMVYNVSAFVIDISSRKRIKENKLVYYANWLDDIATAFERDWSAATAKAHDKAVRAGQRDHARWVAGLLRERANDVFNLRRRPGVEFGLCVSKDLADIILNPEGRTDKTVASQPAVARGRLRQTIVAVVLGILSAATAAAAQLAPMPSPGVRDFLLTFAGGMFFLATGSVPRRGRQADRMRRKGQN